MRPILYFCYADRLKNSTNERDWHKNLFLKHVLNKESGKISFFHNMESNDHILSNYFEKIELLHLSGDLNIKVLETNREVPFESFIANDIIENLKQSDNKIKIIFLNGCSNKDIISSLKGIGIPGIIALSNLIAENERTIFSIKFYEILSEGKSIKVAFETAKKHTGLELSTYYTTQDYSNVNSGLFLQEGFDWNINPVRTGKQNNIDNTFRPTLYQSLLREGVSDILELEASNEDFESLNAKITECFPDVLKDFLNKILSVDYQDQTKEEKIKTIYNAYQIFCEFVVLIFLSNLFYKCIDYARQMNYPQITLPKVGEYNSDLIKILEFLGKKREDATSKDLIPNIRSIRTIIEQFDNNHYFIDELRTISVQFYQDHDFIRCYDFFNNLRGVINRNNYMAKENDCKEAEEHFTFFVSTVIFATRYKFVLLKSIEVINPCVVHNPTYELESVKIKNYNSKDTNNVQVQGQIQNNDFIKCIFLSKTEDNAIDRKLNLHPFLIDSNIDTSDAEKSHLFVFSHYDEKISKFVYEDPLSPESKAEKVGEHFNIINDFISALRDI